MSRGAIDHTKDEYLGGLAGSDHRLRYRVRKPPPLVSQQQGLRASVDAEADRHQPTPLSPSGPRKGMCVARG